MLAAMWLLSIVSTHAQPVPPIAGTNSVRLTPNARLVWDRSPQNDVVGYYAMYGTKRIFTTNIFVPLTVFSPVEYGIATFSVTAVNLEGFESNAAFAITNLVRVPTVVTGPRIVP